MLMIIIMKKWIAKNGNEKIRRIYKSKLIRKITKKLKDEYNYYKNHNVTFLTPNTETSEIMKISINEESDLSIKEITWYMYSKIEFNLTPDIEDLDLLITSDKEKYDKILKNINNYISENNNEEETTEEQA